MNPLSFGDRAIIHVDMDAFYASVEQQDVPALRGKPVGVGGTASGRGVVVAASYEARKFGVRAPMNAAKAKKLCPGLIFRKARFDRYREINRIFRKILAEVTDVVEPLALDEAYLDVTENKLKETDPKKIAVYLRARIKGQTGLTASAGVAPNKLLAKIASDLKKPNGLVVVHRDEIERFVHQLKIKKLWGVGPATAKRLQAYGLETTLDVRERGRERVLRQCGNFGERLWNMAHGIDHRRVQGRGQAKSIGAERTFFDGLKSEAVEQEWNYFASRLLASLKKKKLQSKTITVKIRFMDFSTLTRSHTLLKPITLKAELVTEAKKLYFKANPNRKRVRLLGVSLKNISSQGEDPQISLDI